MLLQNAQVEHMVLAVKTVTAKTVVTDSVVAMLEAVKLDGQALTVSKVGRYKVQYRNY